MRCQNWNTALNTFLSGGKRSLSGDSCIRPQERKEKLRRAGQDDKGIGNSTDDFFDEYSVCKGPRVLQTHEKAPEYMHGIYRVLVMTEGGDERKSAKKRIYFE